MRIPRTPRGFTLIELMLVVAILGTLAAVATPKFSQLVRKAKEGSVKGNLGRLRSALSIYYGDNEGSQPTCNWQSNSSALAAALVPKYINKIPSTSIANYHAASNKVFCHQSNDYAHDGEGWGFHGALSFDSNWATAGSVWILCSHTDTKAQRWYAY